MTFLYYRDVHRLHYNWNIFVDVKAKRTASSMQNNDKLIKNSLTGLTTQHATQELLNQFSIQRWKLKLVLGKRENVHGALRWQVVVTGNNSDPYVPVLSAQSTYQMTMYRTCTRSLSNHILILMIRRATLHQKMIHRMISSHLLWQSGTQICPFLSRQMSMAVH